MEPVFKNDSEIIKALWVRVEDMAINQKAHQLESLKFQSETRADIGTLKTDIAILKDRKKYNPFAFIKSVLLFFGIGR